MTSNMQGTVLITGANGSLAIPAVQYLLSKHPAYTVVLTVRNTSEEDPNTKTLSKTISAFPNAAVSLRKLDMASLSQVSAFADAIAKEIAEGKLPPIVAIICNAFSWTLDGIKFSEDGYELSMAVAHLAHLSLTLRLLGSFSKDGGRVVFMGSEVHWPGKSAPMEKFPPTIPDNLDELVKPPSDKPGEEASRGFQRYALSKLAVIMGMYELNRRLSSVPELSRITALAMDPGSLLDSRAFQQQDVPKAWRILLGGVLNWLQPVVKYAKPALRHAKDAAPDLIEVAVGDRFTGKSGYYMMLNEGESSPESKDQNKQRLLWDKSVEWCGVRKDDTKLTSAFS